MTPDDLEGYLIGVSPIMNAVRNLIMRFGPTDLPVLLQGPTGVGKELAATALHAFSKRTGALVSVNSAAIPDSMFEAEMFGYAKGAFSGALNERAGFLAEAHGGTLFLDEVGSLSLSLQPKLLRALDSQRYRPVGAKVDRCSDFRIVAAANEDLEANVRAARFRVDLFHRLRAAVIEMPALASRPEDIPILARRFAMDARGSHGPVGMTEEAMRYLVQRAWPGNVRELRHVIHCAAAIARSARITREDIVSVSSPLRMAVEASTAFERERRELMEALCRHEWQVGRTADALRVHRVTLSRRIGRLGIQRPPRDAQRAPMARGDAAPPVAPIDVSVTDRAPSDERDPDCR